MTFHNFITIYLMIGVALACRIAWYIHRHREVVEKSVAKYGYSGQLAVRYAPVGVALAWLPLLAYMLTRKRHGG